MICSTEYVQGIMDVFLDLTLNECQNISTHYAAKTPQSLVDQFPDRKTKQMAIKSFNERQTKMGVQLFPQGSYNLNKGQFCIFRKLFTHDFELCSI